MLPLDRRRRARRRTSGPRVVALVAVALVLFLLIGGIFAIGHGSGPFHQSVNRSFAAQASVLVDQSNASARSLRTTMASMPNVSRSELQFQLDALASATQRQAAAMHALSPPSPETNANAALADVFDQRAKAVAADQIGCLWLSRHHQCSRQSATISMQTPPQLAPLRSCSIKRKWRRTSRLRAQHCNSPTGTTPPHAAVCGPPPATPSFPSRSGYPIPRRGRSARCRPRSTWSGVRSRWASCTVCN